MLRESGCLKVSVGGTMDGLLIDTVSDYITTPAGWSLRLCGRYNVVCRFLNRSFPKLSVVDQQGHLVGEVSCSDKLRLHRISDRHACEEPGIDSGMKITRGRTG